MTNIDKQKQELLNKIEELKQQVKQLDNPQFEVGKVYKILECNKTIGIAVYNKTRCNYGFWRGDWAEYICMGVPNEWQPATTDEWKEALINHAKKMGYCIGTRLEPLDGGSDYIKNKIFTEFYYNEPADDFQMYGVRIYQRGKWAKIIQPKPIFVGKEVVFSNDNNTAYINDIGFTYREVEALIPSNPSLFNVILERMK